VCFLLCFAPNRSTIGDTFAGDDVTKTSRDHHGGEIDDVIDDDGGGDDVIDDPSNPLSGTSSSSTSGGGGIGAFGRGAGGSRLSKLTYAITRY